MKYTVFIDGAEGTTGLKIHDYFRTRADIRVLEIDSDRRKDPEARLAMMKQADVSFLCLPDAAAAEIAAVVPADCRLIDTSTAHRTDPAWVYGLPELAIGNGLPDSTNSNGLPDIVISNGLPELTSGSTGKLREHIRNSNRVANPGCHATGAIALLHPLLHMEVLDPTAHISITSLTGYSGGGKKMIAAYEDPGRRRSAADRTTAPNLAATPDKPAADLRCSPAQYALAQGHKHIPEIMQMTGLCTKPSFLPVVADYYSGMEVMLPLQVSALDLAAMRVGISAKAGSGATPDISDVSASTISNPVQALQTLYRSYYAGEPMIGVTTEDATNGSIYANRLAGSNRLEISVHGDDQNVVVTATFDNLGKGASGAAIQNMNIMLGIEETKGLV